MPDLQRVEAAGVKSAEPARALVSVPIESKLGLGESERRNRRPLPDAGPAPTKRARARRHATHG